MQPYLILPSILSANLAKLGDDVQDVLTAGADGIHFDVMDNHFVPNLTFGAGVCKSLRQYGITAPIDVHLMVSPTDRIIPDFVEAGATSIDVHLEATTHIDRTLQLIKSFGCKAGVVLNPGTALHQLEYIMDKLDIIMLMSVNPGFGGQAFIPSTLQKIRDLRKMIDLSGYPIRLQVDGGISAKNIKELAIAGVDSFVAGSAIFDYDYAQVISSMRAELASVAATK